MTLCRPPDQRGCLGAALNLAEDTFELDFVVHIPGRCSTVANELPRYFQREVSRTQPKILEDRHPRWWETAVDPNTTHEARGAADDETAESHRLYDASFACHPWDMKREGYLDLHDLRIPERAQRLSRPSSTAAVTWVLGRPIFEALS